MYRCRSLWMKVSETPVSSFLLGNSPDVGLAHVDIRMLEPSAEIPWILTNSSLHCRCFPISLLQPCGSCGMFVLFGSFEMIVAVFAATSLSYAEPGAEVRPP